MSAEMVKEAWARIEAWCRQYQPGLLGMLNPGASKRKITSLEKAIKHELPEDVRTSLQVHDGQNDSGGLLLGQFTLASCEWIKSSGYGGGAGVDEEPYGITFYPDDAIQHRSIHDGWIPIAYENGGVAYFAVDLAPGPSGARGQIISFGADVFDYGVLASSWGEFLLSKAKLLESGILGEKELTEGEPYDNFYSVWNRACVDAILLWVKDGRWPIIAFDPAWRTSTVMALAKTIEETRNFSTMPILADAMEEAGCHNPTILKHCRDPLCKHEQGCWVIDSLLSGAVKKGRLCGAE